MRSWMKPGEMASHWRKRCLIAGEELKSSFRSWEAPCRARAIFYVPSASRTATRETPNVKNRAMESAWRAFARRAGELRYLSPPEDILSRACDMLVQRGVIPSKTLQFYPAVGGQSVLFPMQRNTIQGFEFITPVDDLVDFFPVKNATPNRPLGDPDADQLDCSPAIPFPIPPDTKTNCSQKIGQLGARYAHHPAWHQPFVISWMHIDKAAWNSLDTAQKAAIHKAARESVTETFNATESIACRKLKDMLDFNDGISQRNLDGTLRLIDGKPVSANITIAAWPEDALKVLFEARNAYLASLEGPNNPNERTDAQNDFSTILNAWTRYAASIGAANQFDPGEFPARTGLVVGENCNLVR